MGKRELLLPQKIKNTYEFAANIKRSSKLLTSRRISCRSACARVQRTSKQAKDNTRKIVILQRWVAVVSGSLVYYDGS